LGEEEKGSLSRSLDLSISRNDEDGWTKFVKELREKTSFRSVLITRNNHHMTETCSISKTKYADKEMFSGRNTN